MTHVEYCEQRKNVDVYEKLYRKFKKINSAIKFIRDDRITTVRIMMRISEMDCPVDLEFNLDDEDTLDLYTKMLTEIRDRLAEQMADV